MSDAPAPKVNHPMAGPGRPKGSKNKATVEREALAAEAIAAAKKTGISPLETLLTVMRGGPAAKKISDRMYAAAVAAAPYCHPRLAAVEHSGSIQVEPEALTDAELAALAAGSGAGVAAAAGDSAVSD